MNTYLHIRALVVLGLLAAAESGCDESRAESCQMMEGADPPEYLEHLGCKNDFDLLASEPLDASLPGARSTKVVQDHLGGNALYFQNSVEYEIHYDFVSTHLSGGDLPVVAQLAEFNATEYFAPDRRFNLGAVTYYEGPGVWALEIAPYDTASADMIAALFRGVAAEAFFGGEVKFHPTSESVAVEADKLPDEIPIVTTDELYDGIDYQPLSLGTGIGRLHFTTTESLETEYVSYQDLLVLDQAPNDISVVQGLISQEFQTPLSHVNVLARNRKTPNMGLRGAFENEQLRSYEGKLVELTVAPTAWSIREVTEEEAQAWWEDHRPAPVDLPDMDLGVTDLRDIEEVTPEPTDDLTLRAAIKVAVNAFGGKAAQYSVLARTPDVPIKKAFAIPVYYYDKFMRDNGYYDRIDVLLADSTFLTDAAVRDAELAELQTDMLVGNVDIELQNALQQKLATDYPGLKMRFRTSTNSEDLEGFPCAGCYESHTGDPSDWNDVLDAIRRTWSTAWLFRTFEERSYYGVDHKSVGMALLVHQNFGDEEANGVAVTNNPYDPSGLQPAFYVNVQKGGDIEVVAPPPGVFSDQFLYYFDQPGQPVTYLSHSSLVGDGETVLTAKQRYELGVALTAIHSAFSPAYGPASGNTAWYAMDVEFKFDDEADPASPPTLYIKQARPYPTVTEQ